MIFDHYLNKSFNTTVAQIAFWGKNHVIPIHIINSY